jgi:hypothetical protein
MDQQTEELKKKIDKVEEICKKYDMIPAKPGDRIWVLTDICYIKLASLKNQLYNLHDHKYNKNGRLDV